MGFILNWLTGIALRKGIIVEEDTPWFQYSLERRILSLFGFVIFLIEGLAITSPAKAGAFLFTFYFLRSSTGGYHAKSRFLCIILSCICELAFLLLSNVISSEITEMLIFMACVTAILRVTPLNHPNMHLTGEEIQACKKSVKLKLRTLSVLVFVSYVLKSNEILSGILAATELTMFLACLPLIIKETEK